MKWHVESIGPEADLQFNICSPVVEGLSRGYVICNIPRASCAIITNIFDNLEGLQ